MSTPNTLFTHPLGTDGRLGWAITVVEQRLRRLPAAAMTLNIQSQTNDLSMQRALAVPFWGFYPTEPVTKNKLVGKAHRLKVKKPTRLWMVTLPIFILLKGAHAAAACAGSSARTLAPRPHHPSTRPLGELWPWRTPRCIDVPATVTAMATVIIAVSCAAN